MATAFWFLYREKRVPFLCLDRKHMATEYQETVTNFSLTSIHQQGRQRTEINKDKFEQQKGQSTGRVGSMQGWNGDPQSSAWDTQS